MAEMMELFCLLAFILFCQTTSGEDFNRTLFAFQTDDKKEINNMYRQLSFKWFTGGWSKCRPLNSQLDSTCPHTGFRIGVQIRKVACLGRCQDNSEIMSKISADRLDHITTEEETNSACKSNSMTPPASTRTCHLPCPVDCIFTAFGPWKCLERAKMNEIDKSKVSHPEEDIFLTKGHRKRKMLDRRDSGKTRTKNNYVQPSSCDMSFRVRTIFLPAQNGGRMCPSDTVEFRDNRNAVKVMSPPGNAIKFRVGRWSICERFAADDDPVLHLGSSFYEKLGRRKRNITVIQESSEASKYEQPLSMEFCIPDNDIMFAEQSHVHSQGDSQFPFKLIDSIFGPWTTYDSSQYGLLEAETSVKSKHPSSLFDNAYFNNFFDQTTMEKRVEGHKFRPLPLQEWLMRKVLGLNEHEDDGDGDDVGRGSDYDESHEDDQNEDENCSKFDWLVGRWTSCATREGGCGAGVQNRSVVCVRLSDKVPVPDLSCRHTPPVHTRSCRRPCPSDCMVSQWSPWSSCPVERCRGKLREAVPSTTSKLRSRHVVELDANGGKECPSLVQVKACDLLLCHTWRVVGRGPCMIRAGTSCGAEGNASVSFECLDIDGESVPHKYCPFETKPSQWESCSVPCVNDCIISEWSDWSPCDSSEHPRRPVNYRTRYKEILATAGKGGIQCINLRLAIDKERCPTSLKTIYQWTAGNWSSCMMRAEDGKSFDPGSPNDLGAPSCQKQGFQRRVVHCMDAEGEKTLNRRCPTEHMPSLERSCLLKCRVDCVVTLFSDWTPCPVTCLTENDFERSHPPRQIRRRFVLEHPREGGMGCPPLLENRPCLDLPRCLRLNWKVSAWSRCLVASSEARCGSGIRKRDVLCVDVATNEHKPSRFCSMAQRFKPHWLEFCQVSCVGDQNCMFTDWSSWSTCSRRCDGIRWRYRTSEGTTHPPHHRARSHRSCQVKADSLVESQRCNSRCPELSIEFVGQWSHCILNEAPPPSASGNQPSTSSHESGIGLMRAASKYCGIGSQYHAIACSHAFVDDDDGDDDGVEPRIDVGTKSVMAPLHCGSENIREEMCFSSCKRDCLMSKWSDWKPCETSQRCGIGVTRRSRFILEASLDGGRSCPVIEGNQEEQKMPCHVSCDQFQWLAGDWSICAPIGQSLAGKFQIGQCGSGLQTRSVRCVKVSQFGEQSEEVDASLCDRRSKARELSKCHIPCHDECAVTMWSTWSHCPENCTLRPQSSRQRHRHIIRNPSNSSCPRLSEEESCSSSHLRLEPDLSCESYEVTWSDWSPCTTFDLCGPGKRVRFGQCQTTSTGKVVDEEICRKDQTLMQKLAALDELSCEVPCVVDCVVSEWLPWSSCSASCGLGYRTRTRSILIGQQNGGSLCPEVMLQNVSCPFQECFRWMAVGFEGCVIEKHSCGHGFQLMHFECVKLSVDDDGNDEEVDEALCSFGHLPKVPFVQPCYVPCPDECELSHWSSWSRCHVACNGQNKPLVKYGLQTRTRNILLRSSNGTSCDSAPLIQSRVCLSKISVCKMRPVYDWQVGEWVRGERPVWCQDDLGRRVQGGCDDTRCPSSVQSCDHRCESIRIPHSRCLSDGRCGCAPGFEPVYSDSDHLLRCRPERRMPDSFHLGVFSLKSDVREAQGRRTWIGDEDDIVITRTNGWTYAIATIGLMFMAMLCAAIYYVCRRSKNLVDTSCRVESVFPPEHRESNQFQPQQTQVHPSETSEPGNCRSPHL